LAEVGAAGNIDFGVDAGITPGDDEAELAVVRTAFVLESRAAGGKLCIHPRQVSTVNLAFSPSEQELRWARGRSTPSRPAPALWWLTRVR